MSLLTPQRTWRCKVSNLFTEKLNNLDGDELITALSTLSDLEYCQVKVKCADMLNITVSDLNKLIAKKRKSNNTTESEPDKLSGKPIKLREVEQWHESVNGEALLDEIYDVIQRFTVLTDEQTYACALWIVFTWFIDAAQIAPILNITSPEKRCGKSTLGTVLYKLCNRPFYASNISPSSFFRILDSEQPTLLVDEVDTFLKFKGELVGIINSGHKRESDGITRCAGDGHEVRMFSTWGAKALIGIGNIAGTILDRSIVIRLRRKYVHEKVENLSYCNPEEFEHLRRKLARWSNDNLLKYSNLSPLQISSLNDRAQDNWRAIMPIAILAGSTWTHQAESAAIELSGISNEVTSVNIELLTDIKLIFEKCNCTFLATQSLLEQLCEDEEQRWATYNKGIPINARQLAERMRAFDIKSKQNRTGLNNGMNKRGYNIGDFNEAFERYLPNIEN